jgi:ASC-1-like (ASCH) protein
MTILSEKMEIANPYFRQIYDGRKTIEGRKMSPTWKHLKEGDNLKIWCKTDPLVFEVQITKIVKYYSHKDNDVLNDYLINEGIQNIVPDVTTLDQAREIYLNLWSKEEIKEYGIMAIHLN